MLQAHHFDYSFYQPALKQLLASSYKIPCSIYQFSLFPTESAANLQTNIWLNPTKIQSLKDSKRGVEVRLNNGIFLLINSRVRRIRELISHSLYSLAIIRQEYCLANLRKPSRTISAYLDLPLTPLAAKISQKLDESCSLPTVGTFTEIYFLSRFDKELIKHYSSADSCR